MSISRAISSCTVVLALSATPLLAQQANRVPPRITQAIDETKLFPLRNNTHPLARAEYDQGAAPRDLPMERMLLLLRRSPEQEASLQQLLEDQQNTASANYHHWLTPEQFGARFGPAPEDIDKITGWLNSEGFRVDRVASGRGVVEFSGTAGQVEHGLHIQIRSYFVNGEQHWANAHDPQIPAALSPVVAGIASLHNFPAKRMHHRTGAFRKEPGNDGWVAASSAPKYTVTLSGETYYGVAPYDFATIYNVLPLWTAGIDGTGQSVAIVARSNIALQDVRNFRSVFGLPAHDPTITLNGPDPGITNVDYEFENVSDAEWAGAVAKGATINLVVSQSTAATDGSTLSAEYAVDNDVAPVLSSSYGNCELFLASLNQLFDSLWEQAAAEGITVVVAAGDGGSGFCDQGEDVVRFGLQVNGDASTPYNVAVGGTDFSDFLSETTSAYWNSSNDPGTLASAKSYVPETTWNDSCASPILVSYFGASGAEAFCNSRAGLLFLDVDGGSGGVSALYSKPSWQSGVNGIPSDGQRDLPDVSLFAGDGLMQHSYTFCQSDNEAPCNPSSPGGLVVGYGGGTSFGAPAFAGIMALINQKSGSRQGLANPRLYELASIQYGSSSSPNAAASQACNTSFSIVAGNGCVFYDVTSGNIDVPCLSGTPNCYVSDAADLAGLLSASSTSLVPAYSAGPGYDLATGLGSVNVANFVNEWSMAISPSVLGISKAHTGSFAQGQTNATYSVTVSNSASAGLTAGTVTVSEAVPEGLTLVSMAGTGWTCGASACTRSDALAPGASYPAITVTVNVAPDAPSQVTNQVTVSGGGSVAATANDVTTIAPVTVSTAPFISPGGVVNAASYSTGPVSPGELVSIFGTLLGPASPAFLTLDSTGKVSTSIGGVTVSFNGFLAPLTYVGSTQINAIVPYEMAGNSAPTVQVMYGGQTSNLFSLQLTTTAPALFTQRSTGTGPGAILNQDYSLNTQSNPAPIGTVIQIYLTGEGLTTPAQATGAVTPVDMTGAGPVTPAPQQPVSVTIGGQPANLKFAGEAPYFVAGVLQVNAEVPATATSGANSIAVQVGNQISQSGVTVWVQ
jgi:uncharacterized protein (TIGR03437 family)